MSQHDDMVRLRHMLDAARKATTFISGRHRGDLDREEQLTLALVRLLEILGEAAKGVSAATRERHPQIAWKSITGTRDRLIHGYFDVDLNIIWQIISVDLPPLITQLERIVALSPNAGSSRG